MTAVIGPAVAHDHRHPAPGIGESYPHVQGGPPVLDIGGPIGALVVTLDPSAVGTELRLRSEHRPPIAVHTGVWSRRLGVNGATEVAAAVFAELVEGSYWVLDDAGRDDRRVQINGGSLTSIDLRD